MDEEEMAELLNEVNILADMDHPNIVHLYEFYDDEYCFAIITELSAGGELIEQINKQGTYDE